MSNQDRELLELAARAAGYAIEWREWIASSVAEFGAIKHTKHKGFWLDNKRWNPLTDDGDALRLAVKLRLECVYAPTDIGPVSCQYWIGGEGFKSAVEEINGDPFAATRRAIVRAAAAIGSASHD